MKKIVLILMSLVGVNMAYAQERTVMNNPYGYGITSYVYYGNTVRDKSYQDVLPSYGALSIDMYARQMNFDNVGFLRNGIGLKVIEGEVYIAHSDFINNTNSGIYVDNYSYNYIAGLNEVEFRNNSATSGGGIYSIETNYFLRNRNFGSFDNVRFVDNSATSKGGAIYLAHTNQNMQNATFSGNSATMGGAIYANDNFRLTGGNILFVNNSATYGGGIYASKDLTIRATQGDIIFTNNSGNAIYMASDTDKLSLQPTSNGNIIFNDTIGGTNQIYLDGSGSGTVSFNKALGNKTLYLSGGNLYLNPSVNWDTISLKVSGGKLDVLDATTHLLSLNSLALDSNLTMQLDVDLQNREMDYLNIGTVTGGGKIIVSGFNLLTSYVQSPTTIPFMVGAGKQQVAIPSEVNDDIYNYKTTYDGLNGNITFTPSYLIYSKGLNSVKSYAPIVTMQPYMAYITADHVLKSMEHRRDFRKEKVSEYDNPKASFYITPYYQNKKFEFTNDAESKESIAGLELGLGTSDLEWFDNLQVSSGVYVNAQQENLQYNGENIGQTQYQVGGDGYLNLYSFFAGVIAQVGVVNRSDFAKGMSLTGGASGTLGFNFNLEGDELFLQPYATYGYSYVNAAKDVKSGSTSIKGASYSLGEIQGSVRLLKYYGDLVKVYIEGKYIKQHYFNTSFYASNVLLPNFELNPYYQSEIGFTKLGRKIDWMGKLAVSLGSQKGLEASLSLQF